MALSSAVLAAEPVVVTDANAAANGWQTQHSTCGTATGTQVMEQGPETAPLGSGSREFRTPSGDDFETFRLNEFNGQLIADIETLMYSTYVESDPSRTGQAPYLNLLVDWDGNGTTDDQLFWEPVYTAPIEVDEWQTWDAMNGGWWALSAGTFGPPTISLADYAAAHPGATLTEPLSGFGSVRIAVGCGGAAWTNFVGNADAFTIGVGGTTITYDFELTNEPEGEDDCKGGGWMTATDDEGDSFKNQGQCVRYANSAN